MPDLLLEFLSEEIPARMQARAAEDLKKLVTGRLVEAGLVYEGAKAFATPRRLALSVHGVPARQPDIKEEKKGPRVGAPENAIAGFLKAAGLKSIKEAKVQPDKKGDFYVAVIEKAGRPAEDVIKDILHATIAAFPWPKSMRWGDGKLNWVRPLHSILATFGPETEEPVVVPLDIDGIKAGDETRGHRFMAPAPFKVRRFDDYVAKLEKAKVMLDPARRAQTILADAKNLAFAQGYELVEDDGLVAEVAGLVEWPVTLMGSFDQAYLAIPDEVIRATIRNNQKCFVLRDPQTAKLVNKFILVANEEASDGGKAITAGNERVIRARLSDAKFFYETDLKTKLEARLPKFQNIIFHEKLGTQAERIDRIANLAKELAPLVKADPNKAERAARLCKADLLTEVVGEFPELQGLMGRYYAEAQGEDEAVAHACEDHYKPKGPDDLVPADPVSVAVALADKIDTLVGFWAIDEKPTGSKDPYALRRAALGVIRLILANNIRLSLNKICWSVFQGLLHSLSATRVPFIVFRNARNKWQHVPRRVEHLKDVIESDLDFDVRDARQMNVEYISPEFIGNAVEFESDELLVKDDPPSVLLFPFVVIENSLLSFFADRLKIQLREQGARHDLVDAVFALSASSTSPWRGEVAARSAAGGGEAKGHPTPPLRGDPPPPGEGKVQDDLLLIVRRVEALGKFLATEDGKNLLAGVKRASNILSIEEKKDKKSYTGAPDSKLLKDADEKALAQAIVAAKKDASAAVAKEDFAAAMSTMAKLRPKVDAFFDKVTVNVDDKPLRENRLKLLNEIREATRAVADFSKIEG